MPTKHRQQWQVKSGSAKEADSADSVVPKSATPPISRCISTASTAYSGEASETEGDWNPSQCISVLSEQQWQDDSGKTYHISAEAGKHGWNCVRSFRGKPQTFTIFYDKGSGFMWWGSWTYFFDPWDVGSSPTELKWYGANDMKKRRPKFVWKASGATMPVTPKSCDSQLVKDNESTASCEANDTPEPVESLIDDDVDADKLEPSSFDVAEADTSPATPVDFREETESVDSGECLQTTNLPSLDIPDAPPGLVAPPPGLEMFAATSSSSLAALEPLTVSGTDGEAYSHADNIEALLEEEDEDGEEEDGDEEADNADEPRVVNPKMAAWCQNVGLKLKEDRRSGYEHVGKAYPNLPPGGFIPYPATHAEYTALAWQAQQLGWHM